MLNKWQRGISWKGQPQWHLLAAVLVTFEEKQPEPLESLIKKLKLYQVGDIITEWNNLETSRTNGVWRQHMSPEFNARFPPPADPGPKIDYGLLTSLTSTIARSPGGVMAALMERNNGAPAGPIETGAALVPRQNDNQIMPSDHLTEADLTALAADRVRADRQVENNEEATGAELLDGQSPITTLEITSRGVNAPRTLLVDTLMRIADESHSACVVTDGNASTPAKCTITEGGLLRHIMITEEEKDSVGAAQTRVIGNYSTLDARGVMQVGKNLLKQGPGHLTLTEAVAAVYNRIAPVRRSNPMRDISYPTSAQLMPRGRMLLDPIDHSFASVTRLHDAGWLFEGRLVTEENWTSDNEIAQGIAFLVLGKDKDGPQLVVAFFDDDGDLCLAMTDCNTSRQFSGTAFWNNFEGLCKKTVMGFIRAALKYQHCCAKQLLQEVVVDINVGPVAAVRDTGFDIGLAMSDRPYAPCEPKAWGIEVGRMAEPNDGE